MNIFSLTVLSFQLAAESACIDILCLSVSCLSLLFPLDPPTTTTHFNLQFSGIPQLLTSRIQQQAKKLPFPLSTLATIKDEHSPRDHCQCSGWGSLHSTCKCFGWNILLQEDGRFVETTLPRTTFHHQICKKNHKQMFFSKMSLILTQTV